MAQTISSPFIGAARSWCFTVRSGLHALVVEPSSHSYDAWLLIVFGITRSGFPAIHAVLYRLRCYNVSIMKCGPKQFTTKVCPICGIDKPRSEYYKKRNTLSHKCKPCTLNENKVRAPKYFGKYFDYVNNWRNTRYQSDPNFREKLASQKKIRYDIRNAEINAGRRDRWLNDPMNPAKKYYRRKDVKDKTPKWVNLDEILLFHAACPEGYEVDHIVPLRGIIDGRPVSGLHVIWNLQYLTVAENRKKKHRITEETLNKISVVKR